MKRKISFLIVLFSISLYGQNAKYFCEKGCDFQQKGNFQEAIINYSKAIELNPYDSVAFLNRGSCKSLIGDKLGALEDFSKVIQYSPNDASAYSSRGDVKLELGDKVGAMEDFNKAIDLMPTFYYYYSRGQAYEKLENYHEAIIDLTESIDLNPDTFSNSYYHRSFCKAALFDWRGAFEDINKAISIFSKDGTYFFTRGVIKLHLGDKNSGCLDLSKAGELGVYEAYELIKKYCN